MNDDEHLGVVAADEPWSYRQAGMVSVAEDDCCQLVSVLSNFAFAS